LRVLTSSLRICIRAMPWANGIQIDVVPVSISAEHGETVSHFATLCDPSLNLRRIAICLEDSWYCNGMSEWEELCLCFCTFFLIMTKIFRASFIFLYTFFLQEIEQTIFFSKDILFSLQFTLHQWM
jgi:hypothetical protein